MTTRARAGAATGRGRGRRRRRSRRFPPPRRFAASRRRRRSRRRRGALASRTSRTLRHCADPVPAAAPAGDLDAPRRRERHAPASGPAATRPLAVRRRRPPRPERTQGGDEVRSADVASAASAQPLGRPSLRRDARSRRGRVRAGGVDRAERAQQEGKRGAPAPAVSPASAWATPESRTRASGSSVVAASKPASVVAAFPPAGASARGRGRRRARFVQRDRCARVGACFAERQLEVEADAAQVMRYRLARRQARLGAADQPRRRRRGPTPRWTRSVRSVARWTPASSMRSSPMTMWARPSTRSDPAGAAGFASVAASARTRRSGGATGVGDRRPRAQRGAVEQAGGDDRGDRARDRIRCRFRRTACARPGRRAARRTAATAGAARAPGRRRRAAPVSAPSRPRPSAGRGRRRARRCRRQVRAASAAEQGAASAAGAVEHLQRDRVEAACRR